MKKNNFKSLMQAAVLICTPLAIASCDDVFGDVDNPVSSHISIKDAAVNLVLHADSTAKATYTRTAIAASGAQIEYSSTNEKIATVDAKTGKITAVGGGDCEIIAKATGLDSRGNKTYQEEEVRFPVKVTDYRARIALNEGVEIPVYNSALASTAKPIALKGILDVWPALDTKGLTVTYTVTEADSKKPVIKTIASNEITLNNQAGSAKVKASIAKGAVPKEFEQESFKDNQETAEFTIEVKQGVAYVSGYDAKGVATQKYMFKDFNGEKYTNLSEVLFDDKKVVVNNDVALSAGWYYLDQDISTFAHNIRIKGDVNIILGDGFTLSMAKTKSIMDESGKQGYKLNFFAETATANGKVTVDKIQDFKEVNVVGVKLTNVPVEKVENVTITKGELGNLSGTGSVNITDGTAANLAGFATVTLAKGSAKVGNISNAGTVILSEGTTANAMAGITTLTIDKAKSIGNIGGTTDAEKVVTATISGSDKAQLATSQLKNITTLTLNYVKTNSAPTGITTLNINKGTEIGAAKSEQDLVSIGTINLNDGKVFSDEVKAGTLVINGGEMTVNNQIRDYDAKNKKDVACKLTMTGGKLVVGESLTDASKVAVLGDVTVTKGEFTAKSNFHAVDGALVGTFYGSTDGKTWTKIENEDRPKYITTIEPKK